MTKFKGIKKLLSSALAILISLVMVVGAFPVGALTITPEMMEGMKDFVDDYLNNGVVEDSKIEEFLKDFIVDLGGEGAYEDPDSALNELEANLPQKESGEPDYGHIVELFKKEEAESLKETFGTVVTVVSKAETVEEILDFIIGKDEEEQKKTEAENRGEVYVPDKFTVEWYIEGTDTPVFVQNDFYLKNDIFTYPTLTLDSGDYIIWNNTALFNGQYESDGVTPATTKIYGELHSIANDFVEITNGISQLSDVYKATLSDDGSTVVIAIDAQKADYVEILTGFREENSKSSLKDDAINILTDTLSAVMHAGINDFSINGHHLLRVDSYEIPDLIDILIDGTYEDLVDIGGIVDLVRAENKSLSRFENMPEYDDGDPTTELHKFGEYTLTIKNDGAKATDVKVVFTLSGDVTTIQDAAGILADIVSFERDGSTLMLDLNFSSANIQTVLKRAYRNTHVPESIREHIEKIEYTNEFGNPEDYYVVSGEMTFGELKDLIRNGDYDIFGDKVGIDNLTEKDKFQKVLDKVMSYVPDKYDSKTYYDLYDGEGSFRFDKTITKAMIESKVEQYLSGKQITLMGKTLSIDSIINKVMNRIDRQSVTLDGNFHIGEYRQLILRDKDNPTLEYVFFAQPGIKLDLFADMLGLSSTGHDMTYTCNGVSITETPDTDSVVLYSSSTRKHIATYKVTITDKGVTKEILTFTQEIPYGAVVNAIAFLDSQPRLAGYSFVEGTLANMPADGIMPDNDIYLSATYDLNYYTIKWMMGEELLYSEEVPYGHTPVYVGETPKLPSNNALSVWEFAGWDPAVDAATADVTYTAQFRDDDRFGNAIDSNVTESYDFDGDTLSINITSNVGELNGSFHSLEEIVGLLEDFNTAPNVAIHNNYEGNGVKLFFDHDALEAIYTSFGGDLDGSTYSTLVETVGAGEAYAGKTRVKVIFKDKNDNVVPITGLVGAPLEIPYTEREEFYPVVLYHDEANDSYTRVDSELVNGMLKVKTTHFSTFIVNEEPIMYAVNASTPDNGTLSSDVSTAAKGDIVTVTATPDTHYQLSRLYYVNNGVEYDITGTSFTMPSGDVTVKAEFTRIQHRVTFVFNNGESDLVVLVNSGETLAENLLPADPIKDMDAQYIYEFTYWKATPDVDVTVEAVTCDVTYTAQYNKTVRRYNVTFNYGDNQSVTQQVAYGSVATVPQNTDKSSTAQYDYTFTGWSSSVAGKDENDPVTQDITFTAQYTATVRKYTVTFDYGDNTTETQIVEYGALATVPQNTDKSSTAQYDYTFTGWTSSIVGRTENDPIIQEISFTAQYTANIRSYTVIFKNWDGTVHDTQSVQYGSSAIEPPTPSRDSDGEYDYEFAAWDVDFSNITGPLVVTATYTRTPVETTTETDTESSSPDTTETETPDTTETETPDTTETETPDTTETETPDTTETETPDTTETETPEDTESSTPDTTEKETPKVTESETPEVTESETPDVIGSDTAPDTESDTETETESDTEAVDDGLSGGIIALIIILIILLILILLIVIGYLLYIKGILPIFFLWLLLDRLFGRDKEEAVEESTEEVVSEEPAGPILFTPIGQEIPEVEEEVVHVDEVSVEEVDDMMTDTTAEHVITVSDKVGGAGKLGIINVGTLSGAFQDGDVVNLEILKEKGMIENGIGRLKVLASGSINKPLCVEADAFSLQAVKMITLTGGQAVKLKSGANTNKSDD